MPVPDLTVNDVATVYPRAIAAMRNPAFLKTPKYQAQQRRANREGAHPRILEFTDKLVKRLGSMGIPVFPHCIVRTEDEQASAFVRGASKDSPADGLWPHRFAAVDIIHCQLGWMDKIDFPVWEVIGHVGKEVAHSMGLKVLWGGDWKFYDPAHWELEGWQEMQPPSIAL